MSDVLHGGFNNSRHRVPDRRQDKRIFSESAERTHWWNVTSWVPRGGRRF